MIYVDATALVAAHTHRPAGDVARSVLGEGSGVWASSAITLTEALALVDRVTDRQGDRDALEDMVRLTWDRVAVVPVDQRCLDRASELLRAQPLRLSDAIHVAAAERLPRPLRWLTFDAAQIPVALGLGYDVVST